MSSRYVLDQNIQFSVFSLEYFYEQYSARISYLKLRCHQPEYVTISKYLLLAKYKRSMTYIRGSCVRSAFVNYIEEAILYSIRNRSVVDHPLFEQLLTEILTHVRSQ